MEQQNTRDPKRLLPLTPAVFHILLVLAKGEQHGYGIMQTILERSQGTVRVAPATFYRSISHMIEDGLVIETDERADPALGEERRRYYQITRFGRLVAWAEFARLQQLVKLAEQQPIFGEAPGLSEGGA